MPGIVIKKRDPKQTLLLLFLFLLSLCSNFVYISCDKTNIEINADSIKECPVDKPVYVASKNDCFLIHCPLEDYSNNKCFVTNPTVKKQLLGEFLYSSENRSPIYTSFGRNSDGDIFMECSLGDPYSQKHIYTLKSDGREYIDGIRKNEINMDSNLYSKNGVGAIVSVNSHKCYLKLSYYESIEMYDFD